MTKRKLIIGLGAVTLVATLLFIGSFFIYLGGWSFVYGTKYDLFFGPLIGLFGGSVIVAAILVIISLIRPTRRKWLIALGGSSLYLGSFYLYFGLQDYFFPRFPADPYYNAPLGINFGSVTIILGILLFLMDFVMKKRK